MAGDNRKCWEVVLSGTLLVMADSAEDARRIAVSCAVKRSIDGWNTPIAELARRAPVGLSGDDLVFQATRGVPNITVAEALARNGYKPNGEKL